MALINVNVGVKVKSTIKQFNIIYKKVMNV